MACHPNGSLDDFSPAGALRILSSTGKTGAVRFTGPGGCTVYLHRGQLYFAGDESTDAALVIALVRPGRLTAQDWDGVMTGAGRKPVVGERLVLGGAIEPDLLASVLLSVVYDPLIRLFRDGGGAFTFEPDVLHWIGPFHPFSVDAIVHEVDRRVAEDDAMRAVVPTARASVRPLPTLPGAATEVSLLREDWEVLAALGRADTIVELASVLGRGQHAATRIVFRLARAGLVDVVPADVPPGHSADLDHDLGDFAAFERAFGDDQAPSSTGPPVSTADRVDLPAGAAWLENLYARNMEGAESGAGGPIRRRRRA